VPGVRLVALYDAPWNVGYNVIERAAVIQRVRSWKEFVQLVRAL
jgi:hypothetical protein